jgi:hypothetical protein
MKYKLISTDNVVTFKMRTGNDLVRSKMGIAFAQSIIAKAKTTEEKNGEIVVDDTYIFPIECPKSNKKEGESE